MRKTKRVCALSLPIWTIFIVIGCVLLMPGKTRSEVIKLTIAPQTNYDDHKYYVELIERSLEAIGHRADIQLKHNIPHLRAIYMLSSGELSARWLLKSKARDKRLVPVEIGLTNGLIGHRVLMIPQGQQHVYNNVHTLDHFRALNKVGGLGRQWFDVQIWKSNNLKYKVVESDWKNIFKMVAAGNRNIDYFPRGIIEVSRDQKENPYLQIEQRLLVIYHLDFYLYLAKSLQHYKPTLQLALREAKKHGLMQELIEQYWGEDLARLNKSGRRQIHLVVPRY